MTVCNPFWRLWTWLGKHQDVKFNFGVLFTSKGKVTLTVPLFYFFFQLFSILDSQHYPAPSENCTYEVFDMLKNELVKNSTAKFYSNQKVLELINVEKEVPYILKQDGKNMSKLVTVLTSNRNQFTQVVNVTSDSSPQNVSFSVSQRFLSYLLNRGIEHLKIDDFRLIHNFQRTSLVHHFTIQYGNAH